jgi:stearoyl-CoA desaturase (delta-9 desaturase)
MFSGLFDLPWWGYVLTALILTHITIASVTIFLHRHQAHRALDLHPIPSHFFRFWLWLTTGMVTKEWAAVHRKHHAKCETPDDPHSPQVLGINRVLWGGVLLYRDETRKPETLERYGHGTPDDWIERNVYSRYNFGGVSLMLAIDLALFGIVPGLIIWLVQMVWIPFWAAGVINGIGHYWGYRSFDCADASKNIVPWGIIIGGEELHNNHHAYATSAKLSNKWYELDLGWLYIRILQGLRLAHVKKIAPRVRLAALRPAVDLETLQAVITNRYDVMSRYMKQLREIAVEEIEKLKPSHIGLRDSRYVKTLKGWLSRDAEQLQAQEKQELESVLQHSSRLSTVYSMRRELAALWARSTASREQLLNQLQDWCHRAEASGIVQLQQFALRLRRYAV